MFRALKIAEEAKTLNNSKNKELNILYKQLRETFSMKEKMAKKIKDYKLYRDFMNKV